MVLKLNVCKSTINFIIALSKLIDDYEWKKKTRRCLFIILKKHLKMSREICEENTSELK